MPTVTGRSPKERGEEGKRGDGRKIHENRKHKAINQGQSLEHGREEGEEEKGGGEESVRGRVSCILGMVFWVR